MTPILSLHGVSKRFGAVVVADAIDLHLSEGEALGILGPNGAGKTTLFGMIAGTVPCDAGQIHVSGRDITDMPADRRCCEGIARSFQIPQPFTAMTVFENLVVAAAFGGKGREPDLYYDCARILAHTGLASKANRRAGDLPLLDRKRLEIARALATKPRLLLLDEVAGGLTDHECRALVDLIGDLRQSGLSIIWIEHVVHALLAVVDRIVVLAGGRLIADGPPVHVMASKQVAEVYMGIEVE